MTQPELTTLIQDTRAGNPQAQEKLLLEIQNQVYYHCKKMMKNESDAQNAAQDALVTILTRLDKLQKPAAFSSWAGGVAANRCMHLLMESGYAWPVSGDGDAMPEKPEALQSVPDAVLENIETRQKLLGILDGLPAEQRMCVLLYYYDGMSIRDMAQAMETSEGAVRHRLRLACEAIRSGVEELENQGTSLYGMAPLPLALFFLHRDAVHSTLSTAQSARLTSAVLAAIRVTTPKAAASDADGRWAVMVKAGIGLLAASVAAMVLILRFLWK